MSQILESVVETGSEVEIRGYETYNGYRYRDLNILLEPRAELDWPKFFHEWDSVVDFQREHNIIEKCIWPDYCGCWVEVQEIEGNKAALELVHRHIAFHQGIQLPETPVCAYPQHCDICKWQENTVFIEDPSKVHEPTEEDWIEYEKEISSIIILHIHSRINEGLFHLFEGRQLTDEEYGEYWLQWAAKLKADTLLQKLLSDSEFKSLSDTKGIWVNSQIYQNRKYFIEYPSAKIIVYEYGKEIGWLCVHSIPEERGVDVDEVISNLLGLEFEEKSTLEIANFHPILLQQMNQEMFVVA